MSERDISTILERLAVIETKIDTIGDHEKRLRWIEKVAYIGLGLAAAANAPQVAALIR